LYAQIKNQPIYHGFIVKTNNDTIYGRIKMLSPTLNEIKVKLTDKDDKTKVYKAKEISAYAFQITVWNNHTRINKMHLVEYFRKLVERSSVPFGPKEVLLLRKISGNLNLYHHYIEFRSNVNSPMELVTYIEKEGGEMEKINKKNYKIILKEMTKDYMALQVKIGTKGFRFNQISKIIIAYNHWKVTKNSDFSLK